MEDCRDLRLEGQPRGPQPLQQALGLLGPESGAGAAGARRGGGLLLPFFVSMPPGWLGGGNDRVPMGSYPDEGIGVGGDVARERV